MIVGSIELQQVDPDDRQPIEELDLRGSIAKLFGDRQARLQVRDAVSRRNAHADQQVAAQFAEGVHLHVATAGLSGQVHGRRVVLEGALEFGQSLPRASSRHQSGGLPCAVAHHPARLEGLVQHSFCVAVRESQRRTFGRPEPRFGGQPPVFSRPGVCGDRFWVVAEERRGAPMALDPRWTRRRLVEDFLNELVRELVAAAGLGDEVCLEGPFGPARRLLDRYPDQSGRRPQVEGGSERGGRPQQFLHGGAGAVGSGEHGGP